MGSPYMTMEISKVNVIRTSVGASKLLAQLCHIVGSPLPSPEIASLVEEASNLYASEPSLDNVEAWLYERVWESGYHNFGKTVVDYLITHAKAQNAKARIVLVVATRYEFCETALLDRCVVFDYSGFPYTGRLSATGPGASQR